MSTTDSVFDRLCDRILDTGSDDIYGDERDRLHWYEAIAIAASVQWIAIPWALLALAIVDADRFAPALWTVFAVWFVPILLMNVYVQRRKVTQPATLSRTGAVTAVLSFGPLLAFLVVMVWPLDGGSWAPLVGGAIGAFVAGVVAAVGRRRRA